jgi:hypothetical protein
MVYENFSCLYQLHSATALQRIHDKLINILCVLLSRWVAKEWDDPWLLFLSAILCVLLSGWFDNV